MLRSLSVTVALVALWCPTSALGQTMDPREAQARKACLTGKVDEGIALLADLFVATGNPNFVFNQGRCFEQNSRPAEALPRFREFLRIARGLRPQERADVERHIAECQAAVREKSPGAEAAQAMRPPPGRSSDTANSSTPEGSANGKGLRTAGITIGAGGLLAVGAGVTMSLLTKSIRDDITRDAESGSFDRSRYDRGSLCSKLQWVGYGVGAAALAGGAVLYVLGQRAGRSSRANLGISTMLAEGRYGVALWGRY